MRTLKTGLVVVVLATCAVLAQTPADNAADVEQLTKVLNIHAGSVVAEIGAGGGELTIALARAVGQTGRVYSNELNEKSLKDIPAKVAAAGLTNVTTVEGRPAETNLPAACCEALFMRNVYHHFADPAAMDASIFASLKPGGRVAIMDFSPKDGKESPDAAGRSKDPHHGVLSASVERELQQAGFVDVKTEPTRTGLFMVTGTKPAAGEPIPARPSPGSSGPAGRAPA